MNTAHIIQCWKISHELDQCWQPPTVSTGQMINSDTPGTGNLLFFSFPRTTDIGSTKTSPCYLLDRQNAVRESLVSDSHSSNCNFHYSAQCYVTKTGYTAQWEWVVGEKQWEHWDFVLLLSRFFRSFELRFAFLHIWKRPNWDRSPGSSFQSRISEELGLWLLLISSWQGWRNSRALLPSLLALSSEPPLFPTCPKGKYNGDQV